MNIPVGAQVFDLAFHPIHSTVYAGLLTGEMKAFKYNDNCQHERSFSVKPSGRSSCRGLSIGEDGNHLWAVGKGKGLHTIDTATGKVIETRSNAHDASINRVKCLTSWMLSTGDDDGVIKLWDPRKPECVRSYSQHFDYITDFLWLGEKKQLIATSGDGTLSVMDVRSKKTEPLGQSEDQEDELLSILAIKGGAKFVVGTQLGVLSIFNKTSGWGDCVDRIRGHPHSIDALCSVPSSHPLSSSVVLTGSSDGLLRAVQIYPTKLIGVVADHGEFPVERIAVDRGGEGRWVGSAGHEEVLRMTDLAAALNLEDKGDEEINGGTDNRVDAEAEESIRHKSIAAKNVEELGQARDATGRDESDASENTPKARKKKRKRDKENLSGRKKKGRNEVDADGTFFSEL